MSRWARRTDRNQQAVMDAFRALGCWVADLSKVGKGMPDLLVAVGPAHALALIECKDGLKSPSRRQLSPAQQKLHDSCPAHVWIVKDLADVESVVAYYRNG